MDFKTWYMKNKKYLEMLRKACPRGHAIGDFDESDTRVDIACPGCGVYSNELHKAGCREKMPLDYPRCPDCNAKAIFEKGHR